MRLPKHISLKLEHNDHAATYDTAEKWLQEQGEFAPSFESEEEKEKAISSNEIWTLHWYPETPVGFHYIAAASLEALLSFAANCE